MSGLTYVHFWQRVWCGMVVCFFAMLPACAIQPNNTFPGSEVDQTPPVFMEHVVLPDPMPTTRPATDLRVAVDSGQSIDERLSNLWDVYCPARQALFNLEPHPSWGVGDERDEAELIHRDQELQAMAVYLVQVISETQGRGIPNRKDFSVMERQECVVRQE